jgi:predicted alpha/beta-fold hydrolase
MFSLSAIRKNPLIRLTAPHYGGHCGFVQGARNNEDRFWVENRIVESIRTGGESDQAI